MSRPVSFFLFLFLARVAFGQGSPVVTDTLDWHRYYPLDVGNTWVYGGLLPSVRTLVGDTVAHGRRYVIRRDSIPPVGTVGPFIQTFYLRYDSAGTVLTFTDVDDDTVSAPLPLRAWRIDSPDFLGHFDMRTAFGDTLFYAPPDTLLSVDGGYREPVTIGYDVVTPSRLRPGPVSVSFAGGCRSSWRPFARSARLPHRHETPRPARHRRPPHPDRHRVVPLRAVAGEEESGRLMLPAGAARPGIPPFRLVRGTATASKSTVRCWTWWSLLLFLASPVVVPRGFAREAGPPPSDSMRISRAAYLDRLAGFWLAENIANWTGLVTEMDKIGNIGDIKTGPFYTRDDWGRPDQPAIWADGAPSPLSPTIDFVFRGTDEVWGSDDDTDIEYLYQYLLDTEHATVLTPEQIRRGWLAHIRHEEENYLWVSNQRAFDLMRDGVLPPETSNPALNPEYEMIDAQLTTEIFGFFAPGRPDVALRMAYLPIRTTARANAAWIAEFHVILYALAPAVDPTLSPGEQVRWMADRARGHLPDTSYAAAMYDFVRGQFASGRSWEATRDAVYRRYQVEQADGYDMTSRHLYCNGCFAAGINFAAGLVSLFYGEGDLRETIRIGALAGWDADNPTATWGGLLGFMLGRKGVEKTFGRSFSNRYDIHRTRRGFPNDGLDTFEHMAEVGARIVDRVVREEMGGRYDAAAGEWVIPTHGYPIPPARPW